MKELFEKLAPVGEDQVKEVCYPFSGGIETVEVPVKEGAIKRVENLNGVNTYWTDDATYVKRPDGPGWLSVNGVYLDWLRGDAMGEPPAEGIRWAVDKAELERLGLEESRKPLNDMSDDELIVLYKEQLKIWKEKYDYGRKDTEDVNKFDSWIADIESAMLYAGLRDEMDRIAKELGAGKTFEDVYYPPEPKDTGKERIDALHKFMDEWVDEQIGLESASWYTKYGGKEISVTSKPVNGVKPLSDDWEEAAAALEQALEKNGFGEFHISGIGQSGCVVSQDDVAEGKKDKKDKKVPDGIDMTSFVRSKAKDDKFMDALKKKMKPAKEAVDSNLVIDWKDASPSDRASYEKMGLQGDEILVGYVERDDEEIEYVKVDGVRYRIVDGKPIKESLEGEKYTQADIEKMVKAMYEEDPNPPDIDYTVEVEGDEVVIMTDDLVHERIQLEDLIKEWKWVIDYDPGESLDQGHGTGTKPGGFWGDRKPGDVI